MEYLSRPRRRDLYLAGTALALAPAVNLTLLVPAFVLAALFGRLVWRVPARAAPLKRQKKNAPPPEVPKLRHFALPLGAVTLLFFLAAPFGQARMADFYVGIGSLTASVRNLVDVSFAHNPGIGGINSGNPVLAAWRIALAILLPAIALAAAGLGAAGVLRAQRGRSQPAVLDTILFLAGGSAVGSAVLLAALHYSAGVPYPSDRTGLYFLPLAGLLLPALARRAGRAPALAVTVLAALIAVHYLVQWNTSSFYVWRYGADSRQILERIDRERKGGSPVRVGISWQLEPALNFYRIVHGWTWLAPLTRQGPDGDYDCYVLISNDRALIARRALHEIYRGPISGTVLATR
jgi:hypothetical protein